MIDLRLHYSCDLAMTLRAAPHHALRPDRVLTQLVHGGVVVTCHLIWQRQIVRVKYAGLCAEELEQPGGLLDREA